MAIRLRVTPDAGLVALCAARSVAKFGDLYLDDGQHYALASKFWLDNPDLGITPSAEVVAATDREESNNANRADWDATYLNMPPCLKPAACEAPAHGTCRCAPASSGGTNGN